MNQNTSLYMGPTKKQKTGEVTLDNSRSDQSSVSTLLMLLLRLLRLMWLIFSTYAMENQRAKHNT